MAKWTKTNDRKLRLFIEAVSDIVARLYARWLDECKYENINDYATPLQHLAKKHGATIKKMHKRPFGFTFQFASLTFRWTCNKTTFKIETV